MKANNKYIKNYVENKESSYLKYWDVIKLYGWVISRKLPVNDFMWVEETSQLNEDFIKICNWDSDIRYFIEADVLYPEKLHELHNYLPSLPVRMKIEKTEKLVANLHDKEECYSYKEFKASIK